ncbi:MAG: hypothetical protein ACTIC1_01345 [Brevibacterium sp.]
MLTASTSTASWHHTVEEWAQERFGDWHRIADARPAPFAPFEAHRPEPFHALPVIMVVLSQRTRAFHHELVQAIDLIRISTATFRPVLFLDTAQSPAIAACDWPVEQCLPETLTQPGENWLAGASAHLTRAVKYYGATYVLAPKNTQEAEELVDRLALAFNAEPGVRASAAQTLGDAPTLHEELGSSARGAWDQLPAGKSKKTFSSDRGDVIQVAFDHVLGSPGVLIGGPGATEKIDAIAAVAGLSSIAPATTSEKSAQFTAEVLNAGAQAMTGPGARILVGVDDVNIASDAVLTRAENGENCTLHIGQRVVRFPASAIPRVLASVAGLFRR